MLHSCPSIHLLVKGVISSEACQIHTANLSPNYYLSANLLITVRLHESKICHRSLHDQDRTRLLQNDLTFNYLKHLHSARLVIKLNCINKKEKKNIFTKRSVTSTLRSPAAIFRLRLCGLLHLQVRYTS